MCWVFNQTVGHKSDIQSIYNGQAQYTLNQCCYATMCGSSISIFWFFPTGSTTGALQVVSKFCGDSTTFLKLLWFLLKHHLLRASLWMWCSITNPGHIFWQNVSLWLLHTRWNQCWLWLYFSDSLTGCKSVAAACHVESMLTLAVFLWLLDSG